MGLNGFTEWLFSALLSWMQIIYNWFWSMLATGGQNEFMPWFSDNWLTVVGVLLIAGLVVDYTIYLMRWQPYHVWLTTLRRARGYVARPFAKEQPRLKYAGYRRVLEGVSEPAPRDARRPAPDARPPRADQPVQVYQAAPARSAEAAPRERYAAAEPRPHARPAYAPPESRPYAEPEPYAEPRAYAEPEPYAEPADVPGAAAPEALDAEGYVPESVAAAEPPLFSDPPQFARGERDAPLYGRVYPGYGSQFMPIGLAEERSTQVELPEPPPALAETIEFTPAPAETIAPPPQAETIAPPLQTETIAPPPQTETIAPPPQTETIAPPPQAETIAPPPQAESIAPPPAQTARRAGAHSAMQGSAPAPAPDRPPRRSVEGYESRRRRARTAQQSQPAQQPQAAQQPKAVQQPRPAQQPQAMQRQPMQPSAQPQGAPRIAVRPDTRANQDAQQGAPRTIAVRKAGITRDIEYDDE